MGEGGRGVGGRGEGDGGGGGVVGDGGGTTAIPQRCAAVCRLVKTIEKPKQNNIFILKFFSTYVFRGQNPARFNYRVKKEAYGRQISA